MHDINRLIRIKPNEEQFSFQSYLRVFSVSYFACSFGRLVVVLLLLLLLCTARSGCLYVRVFSYFAPFDAPLPIVKLLLLLFCFGSKRVNFCVYGIQTNIDI